MFSSIFNIIILFFILLIPNYSYSKEIKVVTSDFPPYSFKKNGKQVGYITEVVKILLKDVNKNISITEFPYKRAIINTLNKPDTVIYPLIKTKDNEHLFHWIGKISHQQVYFYKNKNIDDIQISSLEDLKQYRIGVRRGSYLINYLKDNGINKIQEVSNNIQNILKLSLNRVDLILQEELNFLHTIEKYNKKASSDDKIDFNDYEKFSYKLLIENINPIFIAINKESDPILIAQLKNSYLKNINRNTLLEVAHWWTEESQQKMLNVYKEALQKNGYNWVDYTYEGGAGEKMQKALSVREEIKKRPHAQQSYLGPAIHEQAKKGILVNLNEVAKQEKWKEKLPTFIDKGIQYKGNYFAVPVNMQRVNWIWINPKVFQIANAKIPTTWDEFYVASKKIKKAGFIPVSIGAESWQEGTLFENIVLGIGGVEFYKKVLVDLDISAINSPIMLDVFKNFRRIKQLTDKNTEGRTWVDATNLVIKGDAAMYFMGDWVKGIFEAANLKYSYDGYLSIPTPGTKDVFLNNTDVFIFPIVRKNDYLAQKTLAKLIMQKDIQKEFNLAKGSLPANLNVFVKDFDEVSKISLDTIKKQNIVPSFNFRQTTSKKIHDEVVMLISEFFNSNMEEEIAVKKLIYIINKNSSD